MADSFTEGQHDFAALISEAPGARSREALTIAQSGAERTVVSGRLLGRVRGAATAVAFAAADGRANAASTGTCGAVTCVAGCKEGVYKVVMIEPGTNVGTFIVFDPDGIPIGVGVVATAYTGPHLSFTIADGSTDFISGEGFNITVAAGTKYAEFDEDGTDGTEIPVAILMQTKVVPAAADVVATCLVRDAEVNAAEIGWPASGTTDNEKAAALLALKNATGIVAR